MRTQADVEIRNDPATTKAREAAAENTPLHFAPIQPTIEEIETSLSDLPGNLAEYESFEELNQKTINLYGLTAASFAQIRELDNDAWNRCVDELVTDWLPRNPVLYGDAGQTQRFERTPVFLGPRGERIVDADPITISVAAKAVGSEQTAGGGAGEALERLATRLTRTRARAWPDELVEVAAYRIATPPRSTFALDEAATHRAREEAAARVAPVYDKHRPGEIIYRRGEPVEAEALKLAQVEEAQYRSEHSLAVISARLGQIGVSILLVLALSVYIFHFYPRIVRNPLRVAALAGSMALLLLLACTLSVADPHSIYLTALGPILLLGMTVSIVYDQRLAMATTAVFALLVTLAVDQSVGFFILALAGGGVAVWQLPEIRQRNTLMRAGIFSAAMLGLTTFIVQLLEQPLSSPGILREIATDASLAALAGLLVSLFILGVLPTIERLFDVTTGLKLVELRDSKQPLLRELQQRAPGTFNHSLTIASIAEDAAEAIGADPLLTYVGGLYHDIGKMNKPDYFIENQGTGYNKHAKLRPAMSLLVIVGHVKDGIEMAREFGLPRQIIHFIESHHGTTLVEYFYHAAREQAAENPEQDAPSELEYRYPGPKPKTREAAILMLCDCVESATRAMADPTPSRIESLVHELARKRLLDGQFDDCALTLRELKLIEASIIKSMCAIYHGRISYPDAKDKSKEQKGEQVRPDEATGKAATA